MPPELCCAEGAVSLPVRHRTDSPWRTWGNAPGLVKSEPPELKARFTTNYSTHQRSFRKEGNRPSPQSSPRKRGEAQHCMHPSVLSRGAGIDFDERYVWD